MERKNARVCLTIIDREPKYSVYALTTAAKVLSELRVGRCDRDMSIMWMLESSDCRKQKGIALCGRVEYRTRWQLDAYLDYIQSRICDMMDDRKVGFRLMLGSCQENGG